MYPLLFLVSSILVEQVIMMDHGQSSWCKQCKQVEGDGPLSGYYYLQSDHDLRCEDHCSYSKGDDLYCFVPGQEVVNPCDDVCGLRRSGGECIKDGRIVNGQEAGCNEWPWQVGIVSREGSLVSTSPFCGGTLVNKNHIITAAHCLPTATRDTIAVMIGDHDINVNEPSQNAYAVSDIFNHPDYDDVTQANDISVLRLSSMVDIMTFSPACFPQFPNGTSLAGKNGTISGWGALEYGTGDYPDTLQEVQDMIPIVSRETCVDGNEPWIYDSDIMPGMLCAGGAGKDENSCQGDSGG